MEYKYEKNLVEDFKKNYFKKNKYNIIIDEMPIRWGNIDILSIKKNILPFTNEQCKVLSKKTNAIIFIKLHNKKPLSTSTILKNIGVSNSSFNIAIKELLKSKLIIQKNDCYCRNIVFNFPSFTISGYEAKLTDFKKAFFQATVNKSYVDKSYLVFPLNKSKKILDQHSNFLIENGIGLIGVSKSNSQVLLEAKKLNTMKLYLRLMNIVTVHLLNEKTSFNN